MVAIFDMDGTVIDSKEAITVTVNNFRKLINLSELSGDVIVKIVNDPNLNSVFELYSVQSLSQNELIKFEKTFKENYAKFARVYDGVDWLLNSCKSAGYKLALASNAPDETLEAILRKNGIFEIFDFIIGSSDLIPKKPDPTMLYKVLENFNSSKAVFVGDSKKDELAAINARMPYLQVWWGFGDGINSPHIAKNPKEAFEKISQILREI
ncbi:MAG: HAD family hydrolase [Campylobacter sp.]|nr:HAD family hydrolase [Campylobacter sp.]